MELHQLMEMGEVVTTTLGPLDKYIAANDNVPQDESGASAGFAIGGVPAYQPRLVGEASNDLGADHPQMFTSLRGELGSGKPYLYSAEELDASSDPLHALNDIASLPGFIYLGSPYAKYHAGMADAARVVTECAGKLMARGLRIYCPIAHGHAVTRYQELPRTWDYWKDQDQPLIDAASALIVLEMRGWWDSVGLKYEFESFLAAGKPIVYVEPRELGVEEPKLGRAA